MQKNRTLQELFSFPGFKASKQLQRKFGDPKARIIVLNRQKKQRNVPVVISFIKLITIAKLANREIWTLQIIELFFAMKDGEYFASSVTVCVWRS